MTRLFALYAVASLMPVLLLGAVLAITFRNEAARRGMAEGRSEAILVARTAIEPRLDGRDLRAGLDAVERHRLQMLVRRVIPSGEVLRLRLRDLDGRVVFSDDGSGRRAIPDDEALDAARGATIARLTRLNTDSNDSGRSGVESVEAYVPLHAGSREIGVLEVYLPYGPIKADVSAGLHRLFMDIATGLAVLYLVLFVLTASMSRRLRRGARLNAFLAEHDLLTRLPNRAVFRRRAAEELDAAAAAGRHVAIAIADLDRFKEINDTLGHHVGDLLLVEIARRLERAVGGSDAVARLGGDEFGLILRDGLDAEKALGRLREEIGAEVELAGLPLSVEASIGYVLAPGHGRDVDQLIQRADVAMYRAKATHSRIARYSAAEDHYDAGTLALGSELRRAIGEGQLVVHLQPLARLPDGVPHSLEALVRWEHPVHGLLGPDRFLPFAEQSDLIDELTRHVLSCALAHLRSLEPGHGHLSLAVNVSARSIVVPKFADDVLAILDRQGVEPERLTVEVTETALLTDPRRAADVLSRLAAAGVRISVDDFGRGQTSLGYLSELPIHELKIDRKFVAGVADSTAHAAIVRSMVELGHNLGLEVVGEGVETEAVMEALRRHGCDLAQGFLIARPMPVGELRDWLASHSAEPLTV